MQLALMGSELLASQRSEHVVLASKAWPCWGWPAGLLGCGLMAVACSAASSCLALCNPMDDGPADSSVHGTLQARTLEWVAMFSSRGTS